ncbi:uncharacterized protein ASCRUDRAFT_5304 [Ascoidea rubescens DSM 1968]|uniref:Velvet domain-containing protein n=1 Tax=Ascoidea rubescens DSM 1968 TaxID=1344418 RepID=A0A1D2VNV2_9ASCO|nr:hypothetical protein ASCRUDRAFT_5304 [Ascoidea rubescens DSM 1968]ODV63274.1 hypothetical protein ASCRUDRAFT_5304 [Ascoidea rubescens DSM 1968]
MNNSITYTLLVEQPKLGPKSYRQKGKISIRKLNPFACLYVNDTDLSANISSTINENYIVLVQLKSDSNTSNNIRDCELKGNKSSTGRYDEDKNAILFEFPDLHFTKIGNYKIEYQLYKLVDVKIENSNILSKNWIFIESQVKDIKIVTTRTLYGKPDLSLNAGKISKVAYKQIQPTKSTDLNQIFDDSVENFFNDVKSSSQKNIAQDLLISNSNDSFKNNPNSNSNPASNSYKNEVNDIQEPTPNHPSLPFAYNNYNFLLNGSSTLNSSTSAAFNDSASASLHLAASAPTNSNTSTAPLVRANKLNGSILTCPQTASSFKPLDESYFAPHFNLLQESRSITPSSASSSLYSSPMTYDSSSPNLANGIQFPNILDQNNTTTTTNNNININNSNSNINNNSLLNFDTGFRVMNEPEAQFKNDQYSNYNYMDFNLYGLIN